MKCWRIEALNSGPILQELPRHPPAKGEALIRVAAAGLNFADLLQRAGRYQEKPPLPFTPGLELAGVVEALGIDTAGPAIGTRVAAHVSHGAFCEYATIPADRLIPLPAEMPMTTAAGFLIAYGTSHLALKKASLTAGETIFITGAAGGVGLTAIEIAKARGARVIASVRGADKALIARKAGADVVIDSEAPDLKAALRDLGGIDVTYDTVGGPAFDAAMRATHPGGRMLAIGFAGGQAPQVALNQLLVRNITVIGLWWGGYLSFAPTELTESLLEALSWWQKGLLKPHISAIMPFDQLPQALDLLESRRATGKIILNMPGLIA